jgi:hypothetical protein
MERLIITAASRGYGPYVLGLLGSLNLNWPNHPPVLVYDLGMSEETLSELEKHKISVKRVPEFCPHWRKYYTWKIWCLNDAQSRDLIWMDAGMVVLRPIDEIFSYIGTLGYFLIPNYQLLDWEASETACKGCGLSPEFRFGKLSFTAGLMGFRKEGKIRQVLQEAMSIAMVEENMRATDARHRYEQAIISLLMYKHFGSVIFGDQMLYFGEYLLPLQVPAQKVWVHRRSLSSNDLLHFSSHVTELGDPYIPQPPLAQSSQPGRHWNLCSLTRASVRRARAYLHRLGNDSPARLSESTSKETIHQGIKD